MEELSEYVEFIAESMDIRLKDNQLKGITHWLVENEDYRKVLIDLQEQLKSAARFNGDWK